MGTPEPSDETERMPVAPCSDISTGTSDLTTDSCFQLLTRPGFDGHFLEEAASLPVWNGLGKLR